MKSLLCLESISVVIMAGWKNTKIIKQVSFVSSSLYCFTLSVGHRMLNTVFMVNLKGKLQNDCYIIY